MSAESLTGPKLGPADAHDLVVVYRDPRDLKPSARNAKMHSDEEIEEVARLMDRFGWTNPILLDEADEIIAGHRRRKAAILRERWRVPTITLHGLNDEERRAVRLADNRAAQNGGWNSTMLAAELGELRLLGVDLGLLGFDAKELAELLPAAPGGSGSSSSGRQADADAMPEKVAPTTKPGDVWLCGTNRVMCGDSTDPGAVIHLMQGRQAALLHSDPPYGMGKEADGVANDNLRGAKLDEFQMRWWRAFRPHVAQNGSAYVWGNAPDLWRLWFVGGLGTSEPMALRNEIVWDKKSIAGMASAELTQYPEASERCLFFQLGRFVFQINQTKDDYWEGWEPVRLWLCEQRDAAGFKPGDVKRICQNHMYGHWFGRSQWVFISRENYVKLATAAEGRAFTRPYDDLQREYGALLDRFNGDVRDGRRDEFNAVRPFFDNAHDTMRDVWEFPRVLGDERFGHATPKPVAMIERAIRSSSREGDVVAEPFGGTGATLVAAELAGRSCFVMELMPEYVDIMVARWQNYTGRRAVLEGDEQREFPATKVAAAPPPAAPAGTDPAAAEWEADVTA